MAVVVLVLFQGEVLELHLLLAANIQLHIKKNVSKVRHLPVAVGGLNMSWYALSNLTGYRLLDGGKDLAE